MIFFESLTTTTNRRAIRFKSVVFNRRRSQIDRSSNQASAQSYPVLLAVLFKSWSCTRLARSANQDDRQTRTKKDIRAPKQRSTAAVFDMTTYGMVGRYHSWTAVLTSIGVVQIGRRSNQQSSWYCTRLARSAILVDEKDEANSLMYSKCFLPGRFMCLRAFLISQKKHSVFGR